MSSINLSSRAARTFWGQVAPAQHFAQFYENEDALMDTLGGFVSAGLSCGESTIVIATAQHLRTLTSRLTHDGCNMARFMREDRFITLDAEVALTSFMVGQYPDPKLFASFIEGLHRRALVNGLHLRAFGEMVALLWAQGLFEATLQLELLWQQSCTSRSFSLFCAYPKAAFDSESGKTLAEICSAHSMII
jgi:hypothetical protein